MALSGFWFWSGSPGLWIILEYVLLFLLRYRFFTQYTFVVLWTGLSQGLWLRHPGRAAWGSPLGTQGGQGRRGSPGPVQGKRWCRWAWASCSAWCLEGAIVVPRGTSSEEHVLLQGQRGQEATQLPGC